MPDLRIGQTWQEVDPRYPNLPLKTIIAFEPDGRVVLTTDGPSPRKTKAKPERFNGKRGGYRLIEQETPNAE